MNDAIIKYAQQLRQLIDDYYHQQLTTDDYHAQRKSIFDCIERELAGASIGNEARMTDSLDESMSHP